MLRRNIVFAIILLIFPLILCSCNKKNIQEKQQVNEMKPEAEQLYHKEIFDIKGIELSSPGKIVADDKYLYICDTGNDRIVKCDYQGENVSIIGKLGSLDGEFNSPDSIAVNKDKLCVYDRGNHRIQILDKSGEYLFGVTMEKDFSPLASIVDIEIDEQDVMFFSVISYGKYINQAGIYSTSQGKQCSLIKPLFVGNLCCDPDSGEVFYVSKFELLNEKEWRTGYAEFGKIQDTTYETLNAFSAMFSSIELILDYSRHSRESG